MQQRLLDGFRYLQSYRGPFARKVHTCMSATMLRLISYCSCFITQITHAWFSGSVDFVLSAGSFWPPTRVPPPPTRATERTSKP